MYAEVFITQRTRKRVWYSGSPSAMAMPRGIEPRSPERQSGIITAIRWHHLYKERKRSAFFKLVVPLPSPPVRITDGMTSLAPTSPSLSSSVPHLYVYIISKISIKIKLFFIKIFLSGFLTIQVLVSALRLPPLYSYTANLG